MASKKKNIIPFYFDSNALLDIIEHRNRGNHNIKNLFDRIKKNSTWYCYISQFTNIEVIDQLQQLQQMKQYLGSGYTAHEIMNICRKKQLSSEYLKTEIQHFNDFYERYKRQFQNISFENIHEIDIIDILGTIPINAPDTLHLASAMYASNLLQKNIIFVTSDQQLLEVINNNRVLKNKILIPLNSKKDTDLDTFQGYLDYAIKKLKDFPKEQEIKTISKIDIEAFTEHIDKAEEFAHVIKNLLQSHNK